MTHQAPGLDVLTQIEPVGNVKRLAQQIDRELPALTMPTLAVDSSHILHAAKGDTKGIAATYIPPTPGDPVQSTMDKNFYFRSGDAFIEMPYEMLRRMFAGAAGPVLQPVLDGRLVKIDDNAVWNIPIVISNLSSATAKEVSVTVRVLNPQSCQSATGDGALRDQSHLNPGDTIFIGSSDKPIFRGLNRVIGSLVVQMKRGKRPKRVLAVLIQIFADRMRATQWTFRVQLAKKGFSIKDIKQRFLY